MQDRNLTEGLEINSALFSGSYRKVKYKRMRVSRSGMLIVHNLLWVHALSKTKSSKIATKHLNCVREGTYIAHTWSIH